MIVFIYKWPNLILLIARLFGNYPSSSILHWRAWRRLWHCWIAIWSRQYVVCASTAALPLYVASHQCQGVRPQSLRWGHSARPDFLQPLWGTSLEDCWDHGIKRNSQGIRALTCSHSLRRKGWGPPWQSSSPSHSMLSGRKCNLNYSTQVQQPTLARQEHAFEYGCADGAGPNSRRGSHVYEINTWLWNFGRPQPRVGCLSVAKTEKIRRKSWSEASKRGWATKKARTWLQHGICKVYTMYIPSIYCLVVKLDFWVKLSWCPEMPCCIHAFPLPLRSIASLKTRETWTLLIQVYV